ncbi:obscurin-like protein 1 isoform X2 [Anabas testudineus]|uniref:obscurin-like protein 1 isoform X2 n=1 Tax=Anabas testudineus TaxID=64144 RepID=UPI000E45B7A5|nr:obscurin-like protein 1 isoform X2 [Anabas testudineus]
MDVFGGAPRFLAYPRPVMVQSGTDAVLKCQIGGDPRPAVIWERNNEKIDPQGRYRVFEDGNVYNLIISAVTTEDSGQYICKAKNSIGETYAAATLKVEGEAQEMELREENKPRFLIKPLSTRVGRGEDAVFSCKLWGNPRPEVVWEKDGRKLNEIFESTHFTVGYQDGGWFQLKIFKTRAPDGGVYTCKARNEFGEALAGAVLLVDAGPGHEEEGNRNGYTNGHWKAHQGKQRSGRQVLNRLKDDTITKSTKVKMFAVTEGKHAKFRCFVTGKPKPEIIWRKDGRLILSGRRYLLYEDREGYFTLKVLYCKQKDNGVYVCAASNTAGQTLSAIHLSVKEPPVRFKQPLIDLEVWERDLAILECEVPEDSVPITWYLEDRRLQPGAKYGMEEWGTKRRLTIRDIGVDDDGIYLCEMPDGGRSIAEVAVRGTILRKLPRKVDVLEGENAAFCVEVEKEEMDIHWYKDGIELRETHQTILKSFGRTHILVFVNTMPQDSGLVTFLVGRSKTSSQLRVKAARHCPPSCPVGVQINTERANAALLSWIPAQDSRRNPPSGYVLERQEVGTGSQEWLQCLTTDSATSVEILGDSVPCEADYRFRICSVNKYGKSNNVEFPRAVHLVPVARIQAPLQDALVPEGQDALFSIELSASVIGTWFLNGTQIQEDERFSMRRSRTHQSLRIRGVRDTDNGAEITFIAYGIRDSAALYIQAPLVKFSPLSEMDRNKFVEVGNPIVLYCELSDPTALVHWYKNGVELQTMEGLHIQSEGNMRRIVIQSAEFSHSGVYCCDAIDDVIRFNVEVEVPAATYLPSPDVEKTKSAEVHCPIVQQFEISDPIAKACWYKDGTQIYPKKESDCESQSSSQGGPLQSNEMAGDEQIDFETSGGAQLDVKMTAKQYHYRDEIGEIDEIADASAQYTVDVKAPPVTIANICEAERNKSVEAGEPIVLRCEISDPNAQVTWYKDGMKLRETEGQDMLAEGSIRTLTYQSAMPTHAGIYSCKATEDAVHFHVDVKAPLLKFSAIADADHKKTVMAGCPIALQCELSDPTGQVNWYKDGTKLLPQSGVDIQSEGNLRSLVVPSAQQVHTGVYRCESKDDDIQFAVEVKALPVKFSDIQETDKNKNIQEGTPIVLSCELSHDPSTHVDWYKDGMKLLPQNNVEIQSEGLKRTLLIQSAERIHSGIYKCSTSDDALVFKVAVKGQSPKIMPMALSEKYKMIAIGCPITLQCEVSEPLAQVSWFKDEVELFCKTGLDMKRDGSVRKLMIHSAKVSDSGVYSCSLDDDVVTFNVDVEATPVRFSALPEVTRNKFVETGCPITLQCEVSEPAAQVYWHKDGEQLLPESEYEIQNNEKLRALVIQSAEVRHSGVYSCEAADDHIEFKVDVAAPPVTFAEMSEEDLFKSVVENEQLVLSCEVSRTNGVVQWYRDGTEIQQRKNVTVQAEGTKRNLTIHSVQLSDAGTYTCRAGDNILIFKINVREPPVMIIYPKEDVHLDRHVPEEIILSCELSRPNGVVGWYKDGQKLQESENIKLKIEGPYRRLKILSSGVEDSGEYVCDTDDDSIFFHLSITEPPVRIVSPSQSQMELCQQTSERMVLSCEISQPNAAVRWYRDGLEVEENDNLILEVDGVYRRLIIPETTVKDSAEYVCDTADDSMTFFVNIAEPPVRFVRPRKMASRLEKVAGESLVLDCEVSRLNAEVIWKKNGEEVEDSRNVTILEDGVMRQLTIHSVTVEDAGQYVCDAKDDVMDFHVAVKELPVKILGKTQAKTEKQFFVSDDIILVCELSRSNVTVSWYKDNQLIDDNERYCSEEQGVFRSLVVLNAGLEDSGEYTCDAVDDKMVFYITVKEPPVQIIGNSGNPEHHILVAGDELILECEVSRPNATVQWLWNGKILKPDSRIKIDSYDVVRKLVISGLEPSDSGKYICDAVDDKLITIVDVQELPAKFVNKTANNIISASENESVTLCAIVNHERANVRWLKDGQLLNEDNIHISSEGNTHKLTINPLQLSDSGEYVCDVNTDEMYFSLLVKEMRVKFIKPLENTVTLRGNTLTLRCEVNKLKGDIQWLKDGKEISPSRRHTIRAQGRERSFTIHQTVEGDAGEYACESTDDRTSATVTIETPRVVEFIAELHNITVCEGEDAVFKCVVSPEDTRVVWHLNDKQVALNERAVISSNGLCHMLCLHNCMVSDSGRVTADAEGLVSEAELQVQEQQVLFTKKITPVTAEEYSDAILEVEVSVDSGEVQWMRQGVLIHPDAKYTLKHKGRKHSLTIHKLAMSDRGTYSCETLHDRTQAQLTVEPRKITIKKGLTDIRTTERETASFEVELSHPNVPGTWIRNGIQLKPTNHFRMSAKGQVHSLTISNLSVEDTGTFMFCVDNLKTSARLVVKEPPVTIFRKLEDQRFPEGAVISIECELSRHNVDVKWLKNGVEMKPDKDLRIYAMGRKRFLQIMKCQVSDSGMYICDAGDASTSCTVDIYERELLILQGLEDLDIQEDQNAVFVCEISVEDVPGEWYKNGERIQPNSTVKIRQEGTKHFLLMCNVRAEDSGEIKFVARHVESVAYLDVEELPVSIVKPLQDKTVLEKTRVILDCTVSNPRCSIRWYKGINVVLPSEHFEICSEGCYRKLIMQQVELEDEGTYSVQVGEYSCSAKLTVEAQSLLMVRELTDVEVRAPDEACFECEVSADVCKSAVWSLNGEPLQPSSRVLMDRMGAVHRLTLKHTSPDMSGVVEFTSGKAKSRAQLQVLGDS